MILENLSREQQKEILKNEFTNDEMYMASMDSTFHYSIKCGKDYFEKNFGKWTFQEIDKDDKPIINYNTIITHYSKIE